METFCCISLLSGSVENCFRTLGLGMCPVVWYKYEAIAFLNRPVTLFPCGVIGNELVLRSCVDTCASARFWVPRKVPCRAPTGEEITRFFSCFCPCVGVGSVVCNEDASCAGIRAMEREGRGGSFSSLFGSVCLRF